MQNQQLCIPGTGMCESCSFIPKGIERERAKEGGGRKRGRGRERVILRVAQSPSG